MSDQTDVMQRTLDLLVMRTIALEPTHGWAIAQRIQRRARFNSLTKAGRRQLTIELSKWERLSARVNLMLQRT